MTDPLSMLPIIRQMHDAEDDRARGRILLTVPDLVLWKHREVFEAACRRAAFEAGLAFIDWRRASWAAVRDADGRLEPGFAEIRDAFAQWVAGVAAPDAPAADVTTADFIDPGCEP